MAFCSFHENLGNSICTSFYLDTQKHSPEVFCKKSVLKNFANFTEKHQYWSKKRLQHRCFPVKFSKSLRIPTMKKICERLLLGTPRRFLRASGKKLIAKRRPQNKSLIKVRLI